MTNLRDEVIGLISQICEPEPPDLSNEDRPLLDSGLDSLDFATVLMAIEDKYHVTIDEKDVEGLHTLRRIVAYLEHRTRR